MISAKRWVAGQCSFKPMNKAKATTARATLMPERDFSPYTIFPLISDG